MANNAAHNAAWQNPTAYDPQTEGDPARWETTTTGVIVFGQGMHAIVRGGASPEDYSESLLLGDFIYDRYSDGGAWTKRDSNFAVGSEALKVNPADHFKIVNDLVDSTVAGTEALGDVQVRKVTGKYNLASRASAIGGTDPDSLSGETRDAYNQVVGGTEHFTGWVGIDDGLIHAYEVSGSYPASGDLFAMDFGYRVELSGMDEALSLPAAPTVTE